MRNIRRQQLNEYGCLNAFRRGTVTHHQLSEHGVQLLDGGHGQVGLQHSYGLGVVLAVGDLWLVAPFEAARKQRGQAPLLGLLHPGRHSYSWGFARGTD